MPMTLTADMLPLRQIEAHLNRLVDASAARRRAIRRLDRTAYDDDLAGRASTGH